MLKTLLPDAGFQVVWRGRINKAGFALIKQVIGRFGLESDG